MRAPKRCAFSAPIAPWERRARKPSAPRTVDLTKPMEMTFVTYNSGLRKLTYRKLSVIGPDRIVILQDTTGSGHFDRRTVFADNLVNLTGLDFEAHVPQGGDWQALVSRWEAPQPSQPDSRQ